MIKTEKEKMISGEYYFAFDSELLKVREQAHDLITQLNSVGVSKQKERKAIAQQLLGHCGVNTQIVSPFYCDYGSQLIVGDNVYINLNCTILDEAPVEIGDHVLIAPNVQIYTATHPLNWEARAKGQEFAKPVKIGSHSWIGGGVIICPGVSIGERTVIGAGSVVTRDIPDDVVAVGNPCKVIKKLTQE